MSILQIDGTFRVNAPPVLLGYTYEHTHHGEMDVGADKDIKTLLSLFITIEPPLIQPEPMKERVNISSLIQVSTMCLKLIALYNFCTYFSTISSLMIKVSFYIQHYYLSF